MKSIIKPLIICTMFSIMSFGQSNQSTKKNETMSKSVITITKVKTPWYVAPFLLRSGFKKSLPRFENLQGLLFKYYTSTNNNDFFGGIYLWDNINSAKKQFSTEWFSEVKRKYKYDGQVAYYDLVKDTSFVPRNYDYAAIQKESTSIFIHDIDSKNTSDYLNGNKGFIRSYLVKDNLSQGVILLFPNKSALSIFLKVNSNIKYDIYKTPLLLNNSK